MNAPIIKCLCGHSYLTKLDKCPFCGAEPPRLRDRQHDWDLRWMELAKFYAGWSKDPSTKVGAVVVRGVNDQIGQGYNGFPKGVSDDPGRYADRELKYKLIAHAEPNAILSCRERPAGATLYVWPLPPCPECAKVIIQAGIRRVVFPAQVQREDWLEAFSEFSLPMFREAGVEISRV